MTNLSLGRLGERIASEYLNSKGFKIIEMNFQKHWGELDIVALDQNTLVFIEVKTRTEGDSISPEDSMTPKKINSVKKSGLYYKTLHPEYPESLRIDFVGIVLGQDLKVKKLNHVENITL